MSYPVNDLVLEVGQIPIKGNLIPDHWYQILVFENGKPNFVAVVLLSEIVYWYRPKIEKDELTGLMKPPEKKFAADFLQRSTKSLSSKFGFSNKQTTDALRFLEKSGYIKRHSRTITTDTGMVLSNVQFIELIPFALKQLQIIHGYRHPRLPLSTPTSTPIDPQGGTYTESSSETSTYKRTVSQTMPLYADKEEEPIKHPMKPEPKKSHTQSATQQSTMRFISKLTAEQRKLHDRLVAYVPEIGERLRSEDVCAWFLSKGYTVEQVEQAFKVYRTDKNVKNMGACMVAAIKSGREPLNPSFEANKALAVRASKEHKGIRVLDKYLTYVFGNDSISILFSLPMMTFTQQLEAIKRKIQYQELEGC